MIRVLIADDQALVRDGFGMILDAQDDIEVVGNAADGHEAVEQARSLSPDVILMDIRMPGLDGIEATRRLSADAAGGPRVLMLTTWPRRSPAASSRTSCAGPCRARRRPTRWPG